MNQNNKIFIITAIFMLVILTLTTSFLTANKEKVATPQDQADSPEGKKASDQANNNPVQTISQSAEEICKEAEKTECYENCQDGFDEQCYFDSGVYNGSSLSGEIYLPKETKKICFGIHSLSVCKNCHNTFELRKGEELENVSCEEFFQAIENKNKACNNCLDIIHAGCC